MDYRYTNHLEILHRLSSIHKQKQFNEHDVLNWCQEVEMDILGEVDLMYQYVEFELSVINGRAKVPCNCYRIIDVYTAKDSPVSRIPFNRLKGYISVDSTKNYSTLYMDYYGTPIDVETGIPYIAVGHELACVAYCEYMAYYEDMLLGKLDGDARNRIEMKKNSEILAAKGSWNMRHKTRDDMNKMHKIAYNLIPKPAALNLLKEWQTI